jgi:protoporphyrinogen oxidase
MSRIAILGTGMAGFGAWHRLRDERHDVVLYDKNAYYGGHTYTWSFSPGFTFDEGPHVSFTKDERIQALLAEAVGGEYEEVQYHLDNYWRGHWITHPVQTNLFGLPTDLVTRIIADFVAETQRPDAAAETYEDWLVSGYGRTFAEEFPETYTRKYHTTSSRNMTTDWIGPRMYRPSLDEVLRGALAPAAPNVHYITGFRYPSRGGFAAYLEKWATVAPIELGREAVAIDPVAGTIQFGNSEVAGFDHLVSSVPLPDLVSLLPDVPAEVRDASARLACTGCVLVNVGVAREGISPAHIRYFYDPDIVFARLSFPHLMSPHNAPEGTSSVQAEVYFSEKYKPLEGNAEDYVEPVIRDLVRCGILESDDEILYRGAMVCRYANVVFDHDRGAALDRVHGYLDELGIAWCGRYGDWGHIWTDEAFVSGERAAENVLSRTARGRARASA